MLERMKTHFRQEPVIVITSVVTLVAGAWAEVQGDLPSNAGWKAVGLGVAAWIVRSLVTPATKRTP